MQSLALRTYQKVLAVAQLPTSHLLYHSAPGSYVQLRCSENFRNIRLELGWCNASRQQLVSVFVLLSKGSTQHLTI